MIILVMHEPLIPMLKNLEIRWGTKGNILRQSGEWDINLKYRKSKGDDL